MNNKRNYYKRTLSAVMAVVMSASMLTTGFNAGAADETEPLGSLPGQKLAETSFDYKILPWNPVSTSSNGQFVDIDDGAAHIRINKGTGLDQSFWDLEFRYRNLNFKNGHEYKVSFKAKARRNGMELHSRITNKGASELYFGLGGDNNEMIMGPAMGGQWDSAVKLTTEYQTFSGTFIPTADIEDVEWTFAYAKDLNGYGGNAQNDDELWIDDVSIQDVTDPTAKPSNADYGLRDRSTGELANNYISVNQLGYYPNLSKIAVLSDNAGAISSASKESILTADTYTWELVDAKSGKAVTSGTTGEKVFDEDSQDYICKIDFSAWKEEGTYYLRIPNMDWRSYEFKISSDIYTDESHNMLTNALNFFYQSRSGMGITADYITSGNKSQLARAAHRGQDVGSVISGWQTDHFASYDKLETDMQVEASGGWYETNRYEKSLVSGGIAAWTLQNMYENTLLANKDNAKFADGSGTVVVPEAGNEVPDILDECRHELDFMAKMKVTEDDPTWGEYAGLYYHSIQDDKYTAVDKVQWNYIGEENKNSYETYRLVNPPTLAATLNYAACAAQAARLWKAYDEAYAAELMQSAKEAFAAYEKNWYEAKFDEADFLNSRYAPLTTIHDAVNYGDNEVRDDAYWAACELYISALKLGDADAAAAYLKALSAYENAFKVSTKITGGENMEKGSNTLFNWGNTASAGSLTLALHRDLLTKEQNDTLVASILKAADEFIRTEKQQGYGIPYDNPDSFVENILLGARTDVYEYGSNARSLANSIAMAYAYQISGEEKYLNGVVSGMDYLLGCNPLAFSYVTGYGTHHVMNPCHAYWANSLNQRFPMAPDGVLVGGPCLTVSPDEYSRLAGISMENSDFTPQRMYLDAVDSWSGSDTSLEWNAVFAWTVSFLQDYDGTNAPEVTQTTPTTTETTTTTTTTETTSQSTESTTESTETTTTTTVTAASTTTTTTTTETAQTVPDDIVWGDATCDGETDVSDAVLLARFLAEDPEAGITAEGKAAANVITGKLDAEDLTVILMKIAYIISDDQLPLDKMPTLK